MKIKKMLLAAFLTAALMGGNSLFAQSNSILNLGLNIPQGSFGSNTNTCALLDPNSENGGANLGANLGLKFIADTKAKGLGIMFTIDGMYNGLQKDLKIKDYLHADIPEIAGLDAKIKNPSYINMPILLGLNYTYNFTNMIGIYAEGGAGVNVRFILPCKLSANGSILGVNTEYSYELHYTPKASFAFEFGGGILISKAITLGVNYYYLGSATVSGHADSYLKLPTSSQPTSSTIDFANKDLSTSMLVIRLGICLL